MTVGKKREVLKVKRDQSLGCYIFLLCREARKVCKGKSASIRVKQGWISRA